MDEHISIVKEMTENVKKQTDEMVMVVQSNSASESSKELIAVKNELKALKDTVDSEKVKREENLVAIKSLRERFSEIDVTIKEMANEVIKEKTEERMKVTTTKIKEMVKSMKETLKVQVRTSSVKDVNIMIEEKTKMMQEVLKEKVVKTAEIIDVCVKKESEVKSIEMEEKITMLKERIKELSGDKSTSVVKKITLDLQEDIERVNVNLKKSSSQREKNLIDISEVRKELLEI